MSLPDAVSTRAGGTNSAAGGVSNNVGANVTFNVALYLIGGSETVPVYTASDVVSSTGDRTSATFEPTLVIGEQYRVVAYAKFDDDTLNGELTAINVTPEINNEQKDEYFANTIVTAAPELSATLKRPFGKLRLIAEDLHEAERQYGAEITNVDVTYQYTRPAVFNAYAPLSATDNVYGVFGEYDVTKAQTLTAAYGEYEADTNDSRTIFVDYLPVDLGEQMVPFTVTVKFANGKTYTRDFRQDIPVKRNWLTTLKGRLFTIDSDLTLTIEETFEGETELNTQYTYYAVKNKEQLEAALTSNDEHIYVELDADVEYDVAAWQNKAMGGDKTQSITINGEQVLTRGSYPTLTFNQTNSDWNNIATKNGAKLILKNLNVTNSGRNDGPWNRHDLNFACDVEMENVVSDKAIALKAGGVLKNVTIEDKNTSDTYALWIQPKGQVVTLEGCTINMPVENAGRGIKIDEQYLDEVKAPTLNVSGTTFKTEEKAAVIVKSKDGAIINWREGNDISEVEADSTFAVWVDEASETYADKVIVNGAYKTIEGKSAVAKSDADLTTAINEGKTSILLANGNYTMPAITDKNVTILGSRDVVITINKPAMHGSDITLQGVTVKASGTYTGIQHVNTVTYNNVKVIGEMCLYGEKVAFNNCEFELNNQYIWTYGAKNAEFNGCEFNTNGKAILVYNEGSGATNVVVKGCKFNATAGAKAGAIANQNCAAIEIDNFQNSGKGVAHKVTATSNTVGANFSGEWRIKNYVAGNPITVNGVNYTQIALDGKLMTIDANKNVTVVE